MSDKSNPSDILEAFGQFSLIAGGLASHASDIAHARRVLYQAYLAEGFTEAQAVELCKVLLVQ